VNLFFKSLKIQARVVYALLLREIITRYGRHGLGVFWLMLEPMIFTTGVALIWNAMRLHTIASVPVVAFAITGYSSVLLWRNSTFRASKALEPNLSLMYHRNVKALDIFVSRIVLEWVGTTASMLTLTVVFVALGYMGWPDDPLLAILGWLLLAWFALGLGLIVGALSERSEAFERVWHVATYLMFPASGAVFMVDWLPRAVQEAVLWIPMVHAVEMIRHGYFGGLAVTHENPMYLVGVNMVLMLIGLALVKVVAERVQPE
jgi:capsular polysaccharide transport system permease protein